MRHIGRFIVLPVLLLFFATDLLAEGEFRLGIIGTTTSHVPAFVKVFQDPNAPESCRGFKITAAYPGGMPDNPSSWDRVRKYADELAAGGVKICNTIEEMLAECDGVLLESVDGRPHLEQAKPVIAAGKPLYIDKPMAGSLADVITIFRLAEEKKVPVFSASSLRYAPGYQRMRNEQPFGEILGCDAWSPCSLEKHHPDLFWYGIHGVETLFTVMGPGCKEVVRIRSDKYELAVGTWSDGRIGTFRGIKSGKSGYGATVFGEKGFGDAGTYAGYKPLVEEIGRFFKTGKAPIEPRETIEIFAFMEAADRSKVGDDKEMLRVSIDELIEESSKEISMPVHLNLAVDGSLTFGTEVSTNVKTVELDNLKTTLDELAKDKSNIRIKVILRSQKGVPIETVQKVCDHLGQAMLANYLYDYQ